jgi:hypothetical protein
LKSAKRIADCNRYIISKWIKCLIGPKF